VLDEPFRLAPAGAVLVVDGLFLHRAELDGLWDFTVFLDVPFEVTAARMAVRDGTHPDPEHPSMARYVQAQRHYFAECTPWARADVVVDNADVERPVVTAPTLGTCP
jgi:uridine kinase